MSGSGAAGRAGLVLGPATHDREGGEVDLVIPVRAGDRNESLRFALRSFAVNFPHDRVWIVGHRPWWLASVHHIPTVQHGSKYANTTTAMRAACENPHVSNPFVFLNDDMFVMRQLRILPVFHRGKVATLDTYYARKYGKSAYLTGMRQTAKLLAERGYPDPWSYEVHAPMAIDKAVMLQALEIGADIGVVHKRTLYGNLAELGGQRIHDPKVLTRGPRFPRDGVFLSTTPLSFNHGKVGETIRARFTNPSRYEAPGSVPRPPRPGVYGTRRPARPVRRR